MARKITLNGEKYDYSVVSVITGEQAPEKLEKWQETLAYVLEHPEELPFYLEKIVKLRKSDKLRLALVRVQVFSDIHMSENMETYQMWKYTAENIEMLLYGSLALEKGFKEKRKEKKKTGKKSEKERTGAVKK